MVPAGGADGGPVTHPGGWRRQHAGRCPAQAADNYAITATIPAGAYPAQVAFSPDGTHAYLTHWAAPGSPDQGVTNTVSVISTATNHVTTTIRGLCVPYGVAASPDGTHIYVTSNMYRGTVSVITRQ
jgi:YVTN family beta-propeller protein